MDRNINITPEDVYKKLKEISKKHPLPNPRLGIDSVALILDISLSHLMINLIKLEQEGKVNLYMDSGVLTLDPTKISKHGQVSLVSEEPLK